MVRGRALVYIAVLCGCSDPEPGGPEAAPPYASDVAHQVDPFIGTGGEGNTFPGAVAPWGMVSVSPHNAYLTAKDFIVERKMAPSGYRWGEPHIFGFGFTQLSGVGCPDLGAPTLMPTAGPVEPDLVSRRSAYGDEAAWPGYYATRLAGSGIVVEATASERVGLLRIRFPRGESNILLDAGRSLSWLDGTNGVRVVGSSEVEGESETGLFCLRPNRQTVYFVARFSRPAQSTGTWRAGEAGPEWERRGADVGAFLRFQTEEDEVIEVRLAVSFVSVEGARRNLDAGPKRFEEARAATFGAWDRALSRIRVEGGAGEERVQFYTALYHALIHPSLLSDVDGRHPTMDGGTAGSAEPRYTVFSMWDTYRTVHPLLTLVYPERQEQMLRSIAAMAGEAKSPPKWELIAQEVNMMVGDPVIPIVADSYLKGLTGFDLPDLYPVLLGAALDTETKPLHRPGNASYRALGYIPMEEADAVWGPVSTTLEYAFADACLAALAQALGHDDDAKLLSAQAGSYARLFDAQTGMLRPRNQDGSWFEPFDPEAMQGSRSHVDAGGPGFVEGTAWHYAFFVPHDVPGLAALHGGEKPLLARLQQAFDEGHFTLWNEPDMAYPYLFTHFKGQAFRTSREVHRAMARFFSAAPDGIPGNDDAGTLSAWFVFSAMGFYPDCPASSRYSLGSPLFERVEIALHPAYHEGERFVIEAPRSSPAQIYVKDMRLSGKPRALPYLTHEMITRGGTLRLTLASPERATASGSLTLD
jgi:predicted alpha-1,2-mannosidase